MSQAEPTPEDWRDWIPEAHELVQEWEMETRIRLLSMRDSVSLTERIARALHDAFARGASRSPRT